MDARLRYAVLFVALCVVAIAWFVGPMFVLAAFGAVAVPAAFAGAARLVEDWRPFG